MSDERASEEFDAMPEEPSDERIELVPAPEPDDDLAAQAAGSSDPGEETPAHADADASPGPVHEPLFEAEPETARPGIEPERTFETVFEFGAEPDEPASGEADEPASATSEAEAATMAETAWEPATEPEPGHQTTQVLPPIPAAESAAPDFFSSGAPREIEEPPAPRRIRVPWLRVLVLPRSTFARLGEVRRAWPGAFVVLVVAALAKGGLAVWFAMQKPLGLRMMAVLGLRYGVALVGPLLFALAAAGFMRLAQRWWQGEATFGRLLSATSLALVPLALRDLIQAGYIGATRAVLVHPGLSALVAPPTRSPLRTAAYAGLTPIDLFTLWAFVLLVMSASVTRGRGRAKGAFIAILLAAVGAAVSAAASVGVSVLLAR